MIAFRFYITTFAAILSIFFNTIICSAQYKFDFGEGKTIAGYKKVSPNTRYNDKAGYGFEFTKDIIAVRNAQTKRVTDDYITSSSPFYFSVKLPEGNYNIKIAHGDVMGQSAMTVKAECRRLMIEKAITEKGKFENVFFTIHIRDSLIHGIGGLDKIKLKPREKNYLHWDDKLTIEFNNTTPKICAVEITKVSDMPTVFMAGNSTVVDQPEEPWAAWGQVFPAFFKPGKMVIANYAESGETLRAFTNEKRLQKIWSLANKGDYLFIEFAHNDQKPGANHLDPFTTYKQTLKNWIEEARLRGVIPVLVTSMHRRNFDSDGHIINTLSDYPAAMRQVAAEEHVAIIDLNAMSKILYESWGPEKSIKAFVHFPAHTFPNQDKELKDDTHFTMYGAYELAKCVVQAISQSSLPLKKYIVKTFAGFDPAHPDSFENFALPASAFIDTVKPDGN